MAFRKRSMDELQRLSAVDFKAVEKIPVTVVLDCVRSMHNVGSVFRTSDAFRIEQIILGGITPQPPHRDIHKTALGATETVHWQYSPQTEWALQKLKQEGYTLIAVEQTVESVAMQDFLPPNHKLALIFGNEVDGVSEEVLSLCDYCIEIPQAGTKHSLNISVAAGIVLYYFFSKMNL